MGHLMMSQADEDNGQGPALKKINLEESAQIINKGDTDENWGNVNNLQTLHAAVLLRFHR
ncbi:hypothetical protein ACF0H5_002834 [Mactra antiquata]